MKIKVKLSQGSIQQAREELNQAKDWLREKARELAEELARVGIEVAEQNTGQYGAYIVFETTSESTDKGEVVTIRMRDRYKLIREWRYKGGVKTAEVSPSLMAEFGSGKFAISGDVKGLKVGRGTFPGQKHADENEWHWTTLDNVTHKSSGEEPTRPMYLAYTSMKDKSTIMEVAKRVFG